MLETFIKLNSSRTGHDKLLRTVQYSCRLILSTGHKSPELTNLLATISASRKFLRLGTCIDALQSSCSSISHPDPALRVMLTLARIAGAMYLFCDHLIWCSKMKLVTINQQSWAKTSEKCWLYSILLSLGRDIYELNSILQKSQANSDTPFLDTLVNSHPKIILDTVKNMTDVFLPLSSLGKNLKVCKEFFLKIYVFRLLQGSKVCCSLWPHIISVRRPTNYKSQAEVVILDAVIFINLVSSYCRHAEEILEHTETVFILLL